MDHVRGLMGLAQSGAGQGRVVLWARKDVLSGRRIKFETVSVAITPSKKVVLSSTAGTATTD